VIAALHRTLRALVELEPSLLQTGAGNVARTGSILRLEPCTMMASIVICQISEKLFNVAETREFDGDPTTIIREYDPFEPS